MRQNVAQRHKVSKPREKQENQDVGAESEVSVLSKMSSFPQQQQQKYETPKERGKCDLYTGKKQVTEAAFGRTQMLD